MIVEGVEGGGTSTGAGKYGEGGEKEGEQRVLTIKIWKIRRRNRVYL